MELLTKHFIGNTEVTLALDLPNLQLKIFKKANETGSCATSYVVKDSILVAVHEAHAEDAISASTWTKLN